MIREINFDGLIGPTHNYAALSFGNLASAANAGATSRPRDAALQGLAKMRFALSLGLAQGFLLPLERPATGWLRRLGFAGSDGGLALRDEQRAQRIEAVAAGDGLGCAAVLAGGEFSDLFGSDGGAA